MIPLLVAVAVAVLFEAVALHALDRAERSRILCNVAVGENRRLDRQLTLATNHIVGLEAELAHARREWVRATNAAASARTALDKRDTCVVCRGALVPPEQPHCEDCVVELELAEVAS